ncbi:MAG: tRNA (adenosine(37)-N6)-threonylcarbamoyltransferase complex ATPase subunit type 1 TsaE [Tindallia sp. MSAO_Bac2]|nr:MAG: tRNA (adenosine(37)-N6)-threonylcarbamoyltransferase complex ATPase subunit type 1 TsaE [Tindallia sp. MSAO_Bac2]
MICIEVNNQKETEALAKKLASRLKSGDILCLTGDLGAGKTTFTKALGAGLGVKEDISSPTFTLVQEYEGNFPVYHFDVYRINHPGEFNDLGAEEYFYSEGISIVEWANLVEDYLPDSHLWIEIKWLDTEKRRICLTAKGDFDDTLLKELAEG